MKHNGFSILELCLVLCILSLTFPAILGVWMQLCQHHHDVHTQWIQNSELTYILTTLNTELLELRSLSLSGPTQLIGLSLDGKAVQITFQNGSLKLKHGAGSALALNTELKLSSLTFTHPQPHLVATRMTFPTQAPLEVLLRTPNAD